MGQTAFLSMKILLLPYYYYIQYESFRLIAGELLNRGMDVCMLHIPNMSPKDEAQAYNPKRFKKDGVPFARFSLYRFAVGAGVFRPFLQIVQFYWNARRLKRLILKLNPDALVIGSHLGGVYIRFVARLCYELSIPLVSMWVTKDILRDSVSIPRWVPLPKASRSIIEWKASNVYIQDQLLVVPGSVIKNHLVSLGVKEEQIVVTGNPAHDTMYSCLNKEEHSSTGSKVTTGTRYIVYVSQPLHELFSIDYLREYLGSLGNAFDKLPPDIRVLVKFHPREIEEIKRIHRQELCSSRYDFIEEADLAMLMSRAELSVGHHSRALEISLMVGTPVLCACFSADENYFFYGEGNRALQCLAPREFDDKLSAFFSDGTFRQSAKLAMEEWLEDNASPKDGKNTSRVVDAIVAHINGPRRAR
ncbi:hypothetical protein ACFL01_04795 [Planctomycetota bacterium]